MITRRIHRQIYLLFAILPVIIVVYLFLSLSRPLSTAVDIDRLLLEPIVHGKHVSGPKTNLAPLSSFHGSPMEEWSYDNSSARHQRNPWLVAVISDATDARRRNLIRSTWMKLYHEYPFDGRFVVSNAGSSWSESLRSENRTFGDLVVLDHIQEDDFTACTIKAFEFLKWLVKQGKTYEFVTKTETDVWFNVPSFWDRYLVPRLTEADGHQVAAINRTIIASLWYVSVGLVIPFGPLYTLTWDMVELFASLQDRYNIVYGEDVAMAMLMHKGGETANFINYRGDELFHYDDTDARGDGTAWARKSSHQQSMQHALQSENVIGVHQLKEESVFLKVADCFDESGLKPVPPSRGESTSAAARLHDFLNWIGIGTRHMAALDRMPERVFKRVHGQWVCDNVWKIGRLKTGFQ